MRFLLIFLLILNITKGNVITPNTESRINVIASNNGISTRDPPPNPQHRDVSKKNYELYSSLQYTLKDIEAIIKKLIDKLTLNISFVDAVGVIREKLSSVNSTSILRDMFSFMYDKLTNVRDEFQNIAQEVDDHLDWAVKHLNESIMNETETYDLVAASIKQNLRSVNNSKLFKETGCEAIDEVMLFLRENLQKCCSITMKPMQSLCLKARQVLANAFYVLADVVDHMQTCVEDKNSYLEYMMPCVKVAYNDIRAIIARVVQLKDKLSILPGHILHSRCCISVVLVEMEKRSNAFDDTDWYLQNITHN